MIVEYEYNYSYVHDLFNNHEFYDTGATCLEILPTILDAFPFLLAMPKIMLAWSAQAYDFIFENIIINDLIWLIV